MNNVAQQIFVLFFAIFWGTSSNAWPTRKPFNWPLCTYPPVFFRLLLSVALLNLVPIAYFAWMYHILSRTDVGVVLAILPAFSIFGFYRIWLAAAESGPFYYPSKDARPGELTDDMEPVRLPLASKWNLRNLLFGATYVVVGTVPTLLCLCRAA
jgi:hypothetical protein